MLEYLPWSKEIHEKCLEKYGRGIFSCLDIELGGECNYHCAYCDSPDREKVCTIKIEGLECLIQTNQFDWVYVCGLGEPTFNGNYEKFIAILNLCEKYNLHCSTFSNLSTLNNELIKYIESDILHILFKYDSNNRDMVRTLYGTDHIKEQLNNIKKAAQYVLNKNDTTNLAASIVPTQLNKDEIISIVEECLNAGIFPLLGELELSGKGQTNYENLWLNKDELFQIKEKVDRMWGGKYAIPICPSVISGIHINYDSKITVDDFSGLSCHWFWLKEPKTKTLLNFDDTADLKKIEEAIMSYRDKQITHVRDYFKGNEDVGLAFGGCGGNVRQIFEQYMANHKGQL